MPSYVEFAPPARLAQLVECVWAMRHSGESPSPHRVLPDGCGDIIFTCGSGKPTLQVVGAMTQFQDVRMPSGHWLTGVRFHPGMWTAQIGVPGNLITDKQPAIEEFWGKRARVLLDRLQENSSPENCAQLLVESLSSEVPKTPMQRALAWMRRQNGLVSLDEVASQAGLSPRQFRRLCLQETGLSPKLLARILRFRHSISLIRQQHGEHAGLAVDCGYFDQSHFIADFQRFSGSTPAAYCS